MILASRFSSALTLRLVQNLASRQARHGGGGGRAGRAGGIGVSVGISSSSCGVSMGPNVTGSGGNNVPVEINGGASNASSKGKNRGDDDATKLGGGKGGSKGIDDENDNSLGAGSNALRDEVGSKSSPLDDLKFDFGEVDTSAILGL